MNVTVADKPLSEVDAGLHAAFLFDGDDLPAELAGARGASEAEGGFRKSAVLHPDKPDSVVVVGLGKRDDFTPERARVAAAVAAQAAAKRKATSLAMILPGEGGDKGGDAGEAPATAAALVEGATLASYRFDRYKSKPVGEDDGDEARMPRLEDITILTGADVGDAVEVARVSSEAANRARELQNLPSNLATPSYLAERALELAVQHDSLTCEVMERDEMVERGMGGLEAVSAGTDEPPKLIVIRHTGTGPLTALVGKGVTFDSGGISIKPSGGMQEMKMDMSGSATVIETMGAIAELRLPANVIGLVPATENMPSGHAVKPGDIITQLNGVTVEVNNTDAEGRLILADALAYSVELGAERLIDLATLTGAVLVALGSTYAALISNDDELASEVAAAGERTGELAWRLPLHDEYKQLTKGSDADLTNAAAKRKAGTIYAGSFLEEFVDGVPWAHLDIAGTAWDTGRAYVGKGPTGWGVRLLVELLREDGERSDGE